MTVIRDTIDLGASAEDRYRHLRRIVENVLGDTDPGVDDADRRRWITWVLLYVMWHEGQGATTRRQGGGPARGLMQFEPQTLWDLISYYVFGSTPGVIANLAAAAGVTPEEMRAALDAFRRFREARDRNVWPNPQPNDPAGKIEEWLLNADSFGIKLCRYSFRAQGDLHKFPPAKPEDLTFDPQADEAKDEHATHWARWWRKQFASAADEEEKKATFRERAEQLDEVAERATANPPPEPTPPPEPQPPPPQPDPAPPPKPLDTPRKGCMPMMLLFSAVGLWFLLRV